MKFEECEAKEPGLCRGNGIFTGYKWKGAKLCARCIQIDITKKGTLREALSLLGS